MNYVSAATVKRGLVDPLMEAQARNDEQARLVFDPSLAVDSATEHAQEILKRPDDVDHVIEHVSGLIVCLRKLLESNVGERDEELIATGVADQLARQIHTDTIHGVVKSASYRDHAAGLRPHLAVIAAPRDHDGVTYFVACRSVEDVLRSVIPAQLFTAGLRNELGDGPYGLLCELHDACERQARS